MSGPDSCNMSCVGGEGKHELKTSRSTVVFGTLKERGIAKTVNNLCMLSFSSIFHNIKILMRPLTAVKRNLKSKLSLINGIVRDVQKYSKYNDIIHL